MTSPADHVLPRTEFEALVRAHHAAVYASALRIVRDAEAAADVTQDVYLSVLEGRIVLSGDEDERVLRWFAIRRGLQALRERSQRGRREELYAMQQPEARVDTTVESRETAGVVERFVARLPEDLRTALQLRFAEGLTFARIGEALEVSEPVAFERVKRALEKLKDGLARAGLPAVALDVEHTLTVPLPGPSVPAPLVPKLLALGAGAKAASTTLWLALSAVLVATLVLVVPRLLATDDTPTEVAATRAPAPPPQAALPAQALDSPTPAGSAALARAPAWQLADPGSNSIEWKPVEAEARIVGRLLDAEHRPAADRVVVAESAERDGKIARYAGRGRTEADGRFSIPVSVGSDAATGYVLVLEGRTQLVERGADDVVHVTAGSTVDAGTLQIAAGAADEAGHYELDVRVLDASGRPVVDQYVHVLRNLTTVGGWVDHVSEVTEKTDARGLARLAGERVGSKRIVVDGRSRGLRRVVRALDVGRGQLALEVVLEQGLTLTGRVVDVDGRSVAPDPADLQFGRAFQLHARAVTEPDEWVFAQFDPDGGFTIGGLDPVDHELGIQGGAWSPICLDGVRPPRAGLTITLKLDDDPIDRGDHCAEIHARVVDERTQVPVPVDVLAVEAVRLPEGITPVGFATDRVAALMHPRPVQIEWMGDYPALSDQVRATGLAAGTYALVVRADGYAPEFLAPLALAPRELVSGRILSLVPPVQLRGRVTDPGGKAVPGAFVCVTGVGTDSEDQVAEIEREMARTDGHPSLAHLDLVETSSDGSFEIRALSPRYEYVVRAFHRAFVPVASARVRAGGDPVAVAFEAAR